MKAKKGDHVRIVQRKSSRGDTPENWVGKVGTVTRVSDTGYVFVEVAGLPQFVQVKGVSDILIAPDEYEIVTDEDEGDRELWETEAAGLLRQWHDFEQADLASNDRVNGRWYRVDPVNSDYSEDDEIEF